MNPSRYPNKAHFREGLIANISSLTVVLLVLILAVWQGRYGTDPHHWGLMLSNVVDLSQGMHPYSEIFIQYGFLTTLIQLIGYQFLGGNLTSIVAATAICYGIGLIVLQKIFEVLSGSQKVGVYGLITCFLFHPIVLYPWANYIAFPFLMGGILFLLDDERKSSRAYRPLVAGFLFGLAYLSREGLFNPLVMLMLAAVIFHRFRFKDYKKTAFLLVSLLSGFLLPLIIFFGYLYFSGLIFAWYKIAVLVPKAYLQTYFHYMVTISFIRPLAMAIKDGFLSLNIRWILFVLIIVINASIVFKYIRCRIKKVAIEGKDDNQVLIALASLLLISTTLHLAEIFRIATASIVGLACVFNIINHSEKKWKYAFYILILWLLAFNIFVPTANNLFYPTKDKLTEGIRVESPQVFHDQIWTPDVISYYQEVGGALHEIKDSHCPIQYQYNYTMDSFFSLISPFQRYQLQPFWMPWEFDFLNTQFNVKDKISQAGDIVLLQTVDVSKVSSYVPPVGFYVYRHIPIPPFVFLPANHELLILVPDGCKKQLTAHPHS